MQAQAVAPPEQPAVDRSDGRRPLVNVTATAAPSSREPARSPGVPDDPVLSLEGLSCWYGSFRAVRDVSIEILPREVTALIGPSGCGKSTLLRTMNRMNDLIPSYRTDGHVRVRWRGPVRPGRRPGGGAAQDRDGVPEAESLPEVDLRQRRLRARASTATAGNMDEIVERSLRRAALWDEVKDKLKQSGMALSGGQQQRLCIARTIAVEPEVILMDEPCSALDPRSTLQIEDLMAELKRDYTIVIVTHNMQQAARASDKTVFLTMGDDRAGYVVEVGDTVKIFTNPREQLTEDYISGRFG